MEWIDLRSDTVTKPSKKMIEAMYNAKVGDDVFGDDETVNLLESKSAKMLGKEAGLFVPSGTFANQLALLTMTQRGDEVIIPNCNHIHMYEVGASSVISNVQLKTIASKNGELTLGDLENAYRGQDIHYPRTALICMENAHSNGNVIGLENIAMASGFAREKKIPIYLDGARIFNAAIALGTRPENIAKHFDALMFCFSKGLSAPIGSILLGTSGFIDMARKNRKLMGGGMRQVGFIAAPCLVALDTMIDRLNEDHINAKYLAKKIEGIDNITVLKDRLDINMVFLKTEVELDETRLLSGLLKNRIKILGSHHKEFRFVTHYGLDKDDIDRFVEVFEKEFRKAAIGKKN